MKLKKILSGPFVWIFIAIGVLIIGSSLMGGSGFKQVDTKTGLEFISSGKAKSVQIMDADQRVDVTLVSPDAEASVFRQNRNAQAPRQGKRRNCGQSATRRRPRPIQRVVVEGLRRG